MYKYIYRYGNLPKMLIALNTILMFPTKGVERKKKPANRKYRNIR